MTVISKYYGAYYKKLSKKVQDSLAQANEVAESTGSCATAATTVAAASARPQLPYVTSGHLVTLRVGACARASGCVGV